MSDEPGEPMYLSNVRGNWRQVGRSGVRECLLFAYFGIVVGGPALSARAGEAVSQSSVMVFDMAAQPLTSALDTYSAATGFQVVYDGSLAMGLRPKPVSGSMPPDVALRNLLEGTGLVAIYAGNTFTVVPNLPDESQAAVSLDGFMPYLGAIQGRVEQAFCQSPLTRPGRYRIKFKFWIGPEGEFLQPQLLASTNDGARDEAIKRVLARLAIDRPPPPGMPQPVVMAISSRALADTGDCAFVGPATAGRISP